MSSDRLVRLGAALFALGLVGIVLVVVPFWLGEGQAPLALSLLALLAPVGLGVALLGLLLGSRSSHE